MKKHITKIGLLGAAITVGIILSSFTIIKKRTIPEEESIVVTKSGDLDEYYKVHDYVRKNICAVIRENLKNNAGSKTSYMSRCPSGYLPNIATEEDSVKLNKVVYGEVNYYKGCTPSYICNFKVCVSLGITEVKTKGMKDFIPLKEWLATKNKPAGAVVKG